MFSYEKISLFCNDTFFCKCPVLMYLHARELFMFLFSSADFLQNLVFFTNKPPRTTIGVPNSLDPDQDRHSVGLHLGSNCLQKAFGRRKLSAGMQRVITGKYFNVQYIISYW